MNDTYSSFVLWSTQSNESGCQADRQINSLYVSKRLKPTQKLFLAKNYRKSPTKLTKMAQKRASDALVAVPDLKRARNELVAITNRDKALLETVRNIL